MMIPNPGPGIFLSVEGLAEARAVPGIEAIEITAKPGEMLIPLPEGASYPGFIFARAESAGGVDSALRTAYARLRFHLTQALPVVR